MFFFPLILFNFRRKFHSSSVRSSVLKIQLSLLLRSVHYHHLTNAKRIEIQFLSNFVEIAYTERVVIIIVAVSTDDKLTARRMFVYRELLEQWSWFEWPVVYKR